VDGKTAELVGSKMIGLLDGAPEVHTITADNGKEFAGHTHVAQAHDAEFHFAGPCHSRERGLDEHTDGLVREHFPKGTDFRLVSDAEVRKVQDRPNACPRSPGIPDAHGSLARSRGETAPILHPRPDPSPHRAAGSPPRDGEPCLEDGASPA